MTRLKNNFIFGRVTNEIVYVDIIFKDFEGVHNNLVITIWMRHVGLIKFDSHVKNVCTLFKKNTPLGIYSVSFI